MPMTASEEAAAFARLSEITGMPAEKWRDILKLPPAAQKVVLRDYEDCDWAVPGDKLSAFLAALGVVGQIVGFATGAASLVSALPLKLL